MGECPTRHHGNRQGARERLPGRRLSGHRARRGRDGGRVARLDLRRQPVGHGGRQCRSRHDARARLFRLGGSDGQAAARPARNICPILSQAVSRSAGRGVVARHPLPRDSRRFCRQVAAERIIDLDCGRQCAAHSAAADCRRARHRRSARHHKQGGAGMAGVRGAARDLASIGERHAPPGPPRHFLDIDQFDPVELRAILDTGFAYKNGRRDRPLAGKTLAMIFEKPSTRTRVSFEVAMRQLGGETIYLSTADSQLGRGETVADTARVLSRYVDAIMIRTNQPRKLDDLARHATVPVINGLTDTSHPCQIMADVMTLQEKKGPLAGKVVAWSGDGNNVAASWVHAAVRFGFALRIACPVELSPPHRLFEWAHREGGRVLLTAEPLEAVAGADCVVTDTWISMGAEASVNRHNMLAPYRVDERLMAHAKPDAIFMHCLPAKRGEEVTAGVIDGPQSVVWDEAENRLHAQKGILAWCLAEGR